MVVEVPIQEKRKVEIKAGDRIIYNPYGKTNFEGVIIKVVESKVSTYPIIKIKTSNYTGYTAKFSFNTFGKKWFLDGDD